MRSHKHVIGHTQRATVFATVFAAIALIVGAPSTGWAQQTPQMSQTAQLDARWQPWIGCWRPAAPPSVDPISYSTTPRSSDAPLVCVIPASGGNTSSSVNVVTVKDGKIVSRDTIVATGSNVARSKDGCSGIESAKWSADGHRLYVSSDFTCPGGLKRTSSGLFAISPQGQWVNVQSVNASGTTAVRTLRYSDAGVPSSVPSEISDALANQTLAVSSARAAAGERLSTAAIIDASHNTDSSAVAAWLIDRGQGFNVDATQLVALSDAGLPGNVTDAMVALSYPKAFALSHSENVEGAVAGDNTAGAELERAKAPNVAVIMAPAYAPFSYAPFRVQPIRLLRLRIFAVWLLALRLFTLWLLTIRCLLLTVQRLRGWLWRLVLSTGHHSEGWNVRASSAAWIRRKGKGLHADRAAERIVDRATAPDRFIAATFVEWTYGKPTAVAARVVGSHGPSATIGNDESVSLSR